MNLAHLRSCAQYTLRFIRDRAGRYIAIRPPIQNKYLFQNCRYQVLDNYNVYLFQAITYFLYYYLFYMIIHRHFGKLPSREVEGEGAVRRKNPISRPFIPGRFLLPKSCVKHSWEHFDRSIDRVESQYGNIFLNPIPVDGSKSLYPEMYDFSALHWRKFTRSSGRFPFSGSKNPMPSLPSMHHQRCSLPLLQGTFRQDFFQK